MPLDDNSAEYANHLPAAVRRAAQLADELAHQVAPEEPAEETPPVVEEPLGAPAVEPPEVPEVAVAAPAVDWEQRYRTLQGKYDAEIPQLRGQVNSLERILASMQEAPAAAPAAPATTAPVVPREDVETYGQELIDAVNRWVMPRVQEQLGNAQSRLQREIEQLRERSTTQTVFQALDADPHIGQQWRQLDTDPEFLTWLGQVDPFAGQPRVQLLREACSRGDAIRCGAFYKAYIAEHTAITPPTPAPVPVQTAPEQADRPSLENLAAPGRASGTVVGGAPEGKRSWSNTEIAAFYRDCQRGRYATREAERLRIEADIIAAASEGRIRR